MQIPDGRYLFGRVVRTDANCFAPDCILVYIFKYQSETPTPPARLLVSDLLIPPQTINRLGWSRGYLMTVERRPFEMGERMLVHYFKQRRDAPGPMGRLSRLLGRHEPAVVYVDEDRMPVKPPPLGTPSDWQGLGNYRTLDDMVSSALGIPLASEIPSVDATLSRDDVQMLVGELEAEVNNGGFDQFFFNEAGNRVVETIEALEAIGAHKTADIVRRACARFPGGMPPAAWFARQEVLEVVSPDSEAFEQEDQEFYAYDEDLASLVAAYAKRS